MLAVLASRHALKVIGGKGGKTAAETASCISESTEKVPGAVSEISAMVSMGCSSRDCPVAEARDGGVALLSFISVSVLVMTASYIPIVVFSVNGPSGLLKVLLLDSREVVSRSVALPSAAMASFHGMVGEILTVGCPGGARLTALITAVENFLIGRKGGEASQAMLILGPCTPIGSRTYIYCHTSHGLSSCPLFVFGLIAECEN